MTLLEIVLVHVCSALVIIVMLAICLRSPSPGTVVSGRKEYRVHGAWFVFGAVGGAFVVGIFAIASTLSAPQDRSSAIWCSAGAALFFLFFAVIMRSLRVTVDDNVLTSHNLFNERTIVLREVDRVSIVGLVVEVKMKEDPMTKKRPGPLTFLAGFRGLNELMATIRARSA